MKEFSTRLKELRIETGLTQLQLAEAIGVSFAIISKWERMQRQPTLIKYRQIFKKVK